MWQFKTSDITVQIVTISLSLNSYVGEKIAVWKLGNWNDE